MSHLRGLLVLMVATLSLDSALASQPANRVPYDAALQCVLANGRAHGMRQRAGDLQKAAYYETKAAQAYGMAEVLGSALGFSKQQIARDAAQARERELPLMVRDDAYFRQVVANCKALGMM